MILHFKKNESKLNFLSKNLIFKKHYRASKSKFFDKSFRFSALKNTFEYGRQLELLPEGYSYRNLLFSLRSYDLKHVYALEYINKNHNDLISPLNYFLNTCYINDYSSKSFDELKNQINTILDLNLVISSDELFDINLVLSEFSIRIKKRWLDTQISKPDLSFWYAVFKFRYKFNKLNGTKSDLLSSIDDMIRLNTNYDSDIFDIDIQSLELEKHDLIYDAITNNNSKGILPDDFISMYKTRFLRIYYQNWTEKEIETDILTLFNAYRSTINYEYLVLTLELYWQHVNSVKNYKIEGMETEDLLNKSKAFIINILDTNITNTDLDLRILISDLKELEMLKYSVESLYNQKLINKTRYKILNLQVLQKQYNILNTKEPAFAYYQFIIDNIQVTGFEPSITVAMGLAVDYKFNYKLVEVSNYLMKNYNEYFENQSEINKYNFLIMSGLFYRYIKNDKRALMRLISARANPYHWSREITSYEDMTRDHTLIYEIFEIYLFDKKHEDARSYLNLYIDLYNELEEGLKNNTSFVRLDKDMFLKIKRRSLDMKRRLFSSESKHEESELVINEMIVLEEDKYFYGKFNLLMKKFETQMSYNKHSNNVFLNKLDSLYNAYNVEFDSQYYRNKKYLGEFTPQYLDSKLVELKSELNNVNLINELSYENQVNLLIKMGVKMSVIENEVYTHSTDIKQINKVLNYKLKVDDLDRYNTMLLNVSEKNSDMYFKLLNKRFDEKNYDQLQLIKNEFDLFQQNIKTDLKKTTEIELESFQYKLQSYQAYIRYSKLNDTTFVAHLITKDQAEIIKISESDLTKLIDFYTSRITNNLEDIYSYKLLFKPIADKLPTTVTELFIKNEGLFTNVNLEALWNPEKNKFLFDIFTINYVERPSAIFKIDTLTNFESAFLFGNPDFSNGSNSSEIVNSKVRAGLNPLPYTEKEINTLNTLLSNQGIQTITTNLETSTEAALYANTKSSIIHLATHGFFIDGNKFDRFNWGLLAANSKNSLQNDFKKEVRNDGIIFGSEIIKKNFTQTELVVLSACETGFGNSTFFGGENLANSFLRAGAKNIISTLWPVDDQITQQFMSEFYSELLKHKNINLALRIAKQKIKDQYSNPNYWAPFVLIQNKI
ncbi:CHAT domain-containing protein [Flavobacteriaceae bacterium]|nr:CHAT domain-containing protein [Flavobacteriaceae bacterium]